jgi:ketosteroid isomerase-like protein
MNTHSLLLEKLYTCLNSKDHAGMADCYHPDADFKDIAFTLHGRKQIHAMWHLISETDLRATFTIIKVDEESGRVQLVDDYTFRDTGRPVHNEIQSDFRFQDGLIIEHSDSCDALKWGIQALGPVKGVISWLVPSTRQAKAMEKLEKFVNSHPEYA